MYKRRELLRKCNIRNKLRIKLEEKRQQNRADRPGEMNYTWTAPHLSYNSLVSYIIDDDVCLPVWLFVFLDAGTSFLTDIIGHMCRSHQQTTGQHSQIVWTCSYAF